MLKTILFAAVLFLLVLSALLAGSVTNATIVLVLAAALAIKVIAKR